MVTQNKREYNTIEIVPKKCLKNKKVRWFEIKKK